MELLDFTHTWVWYLSLIIFIVSYYFIAREEAYHLNKAKPALFAGTSMFIIIWIYFVLNWLDTQFLKLETEKLIIEISEIFFFLLVAMTYIEVMTNRWVFEVLQRKLFYHKFTYKQLFWILWLLAFFISPIADNLTTALILSTVALSISKNPKIIVPIAIIIVVWANSGWAWSPFWDITTLMTWTSWKASFWEFLLLFFPSFIGFLTTAFLLSIFIPNTIPESKTKIVNVSLKPWAKKVIFLGLFTIFISVVIHNYFDIPAMWWMMFWLSLLHLLSYHSNKLHRDLSFNVYKNIKRTEIDTLLFFFWILSIIWALDFLWYLKYITNFYDYFWFFNSNIIIWLLSSVVDNIPVMSAVLKSDIDMDTINWLMLTLTVWIWWSLISFWSAAGIWVMWKMKWIYTFSSHMRYFPIILLWYFVSIWVFYIEFYLLNILQK